MSEAQARVLAMAILDNEEVIKKPVMASTIDQVEAELRQTCTYLSNSSVKRILVYDNFFDEFVDKPNHPLEDREKIKLYFTSSAPPTVTPPLRPSTSSSSPSRPSTSASPSRPSTSSRPYGTSQTTLMFVKDGLKINKEPPVVKSNEALEKEIEERSKIFGKDGKPVNRYGKKINAMSFALAKEDPSLLQNRGNLLQAARKALHDSGYEYAHGKKTRSQKFGRHQKEKEVEKYTCEAARHERSTELNESISSLQKQAEYLEKAKEKAVNSSLFCEAATLEHQGSELKMKIRRENIELMEIQQHSSKLLKRRNSRKRNKNYSKFEDINMKDPIQWKAE